MASGPFVNCPSCEEMEHLKDLLQRDKFGAFYLNAVSLIHRIWDEEVPREEGRREWGKTIT